MYMYIHIYTYIHIHIYNDLAADFRNAYTRDCINLLQTKHIQFTTLNDYAAHECINLLRTKTILLTFENSIINLEIFDVLEPPAMQNANFSDEILKNQFATRCTKKQSRADS